MWAATSKASAVLLPTTLRAGTERIGFHLAAAWMVSSPRSRRLATAFTLEAISAPPAENPPITLPFGTNPEDESGESAILGVRAASLLRVSAVLDNPINRRDTKNA